MAKQHRPALTPSHMVTAGRDRLCVGGWVGESAKGVTKPECGKGGAIYLRLLVVLESGLAEHLAHIRIRLRVVKHKAPVWTLVPACRLKGIPKRAPIF